MNRIALSVFAALFLLACPKATPTSTLQGNDDQKLDQLAAQLEELNSRELTECSDKCSVKTKVCNISETSCEISGRSPDNAEFQKHCVKAQEACAKFNETCSACKG